MKVHLTAKFKVHNPSRRKQEVMDTALEQYTSAYAYLLEWCRENLATIEAEGVSRKLVGVEIYGEPLSVLYEETRIPVSHEGVRVGDLRSFDYSPRLDKNIGYAMVSIEHARLGTTLTVELPSGDAEATAVQKPFLDPKKDIPKS